MKKKKVWRYWCEFCKKAGQSASHMSRHEKHCTLNPERECRLHKLGDCKPEPLSVLIQSARDGDTWQLIMDQADGCPACTLAALRLGGRKEFKFNYNEEANHFLAEINRKMEEDDARALMYGL